MTAFYHRVCAADDRMAGERELLPRCEDSQPIVGIRRRRRQNKAVSDRFVHAAIRCISSAVSDSAPMTTATGFPQNGFCVKTSTCLKRKVSIFMTPVLQSKAQVDWLMSVSVTH